MKVWITKYALTIGIFEAEGDADVLGVGLFRRTGIYTAYPPGTWHKTKESAIQRANIMKANKLDSLRKQIAKLEGMKFE